MIVPLLAAVAKIAFVTSSSQAGTGTCAGEVKIQLQDASGNPALPPPGTALTVTAASSPASATAPALFDNAQCAGAALDLTAAIPVPPGATGIPIRFVSITPGTLTIAASGPNLALVSQPFTIVAQAGVPTAVVATSAPLQAAGGACSDAVTVELRDVNGAPASATRPLSATLEPSAFIEFWSDAKCTSRLQGLDFAQGAGSGSFHVRSAGGVTRATLRVAVPGLAPAESVATFSQGSTGGCGSAGLAGPVLLLPLLLRLRPGTRRRARPARKG